MSQIYVQQKYSTIMDQLDFAWTVGKPSKISVILKVNLDLGRKTVNTEW